ncbi:hypothetical protein PV327_003898 [Microctonus hyperodae]|uniref:Uncharacterized protein n=1 Tax=Microctonus hyperodae TaxID=165561 RepID=A0AA39L1C8_MICHY|nr:hypothetical protein PV327_003898 [Microctonus hyperodae]
MRADRVVDVPKIVNLAIGHQRGLPLEFHWLSSTSSTYYYCHVRRWTTQERKKRFRFGSSLLPALTRYSEMSLNQSSEKATKASWITIKTTTTVSLCRQ